MKRRYLLGLLAASLLAASPRLRAQTGPQKELSKEKLQIVTRDGKVHDFMVEMALSPDEQMTGLMFRPSVPEDGGMLFDWHSERRSQMWMKNTISPLDMVFIGADGRIRAIAEDTVPQSLATVDSRLPVRGTLELAAGTTARLDIRVGDLVKQRIFGNSP
jgi:uncharacterized protein